MEFIYLGGILLFRVIQTIARKANSNEMPKDFRGISIYMSMNLAISAAFAFVMLAISGNPISSITDLPQTGWLISFATGVTLTISIVSSLLALNGSSIVLGSLFGMAGLLIPTISGIFIFDQAVSLLQWSGIFVLFVSAWLLTSSSQTTNGKLSVKTMIYLLLGFFSNGGTMLLQTLYKAYVPTGSVYAYSFLQFLIPSVVMLFVFFVKNGTTKEKTPIKFSKKLIVVTVMSALAILGISTIATVASEIVPAAALFSVSEGGGIVSSGIVGMLMYKEGLNVRSILGIIVAILGICVIKFC